MWSNIIDNILLKNKSLPVGIEIKFLQVEALGQAKSSTIIYDLTVFLNAMRENIPLLGFLIHDGVFHGIEPRKKVNLLNYIQNREKVEGSSILRHLMKMKYL